MYDGEVVSSKFCPLKILINTLFSVFFEKQFPKNFLKICKNYSNLFR